MDHNEAIQQMATERYLLNELAPEAREAFEEHLFDCPECALDLRAGAAFVDEARAQLPELTKPMPFPARPEVARSESDRSRSKRDRWLAWWRPAFVAPAFAALLLAFGYQNLVTFPALRASADQPRIFAMATSLHGATRGSARPVVTAGRKTGIALPIDISSAPGMASFVSYSFELYNPDQKLAWKSTAPASAASDAEDQSVALDIPGPMLRDGSYKLTVFGIGSNGTRTAIQTYIFDIQLTD